MTQEGAEARGLAFVEAHGDERSRRLAPALFGSGRRSAALRWLDRTPGGLEEARQQLSDLADLGALQGPVCERLAGWLECARGPDGAWGDAFSTGLLAGLLARTPFVRAEVLDAAGAWLAERWDPDRVKGGDARAWRQIAGYSAFFANVPHELADAALQWCGRELGMGLAARRFDAVSTARVLLWCDAHGLPGLLLRAPELAERVSAAQAPDGAWAPGPQSSPEGPQPSPEARAAHTLDALLALRHLGGRGGGLP